MESASPGSELLAIKTPIYKPVQGHTLIVGKTMSGKTTVVKRLCNYASDIHGIPLMVLTTFPQDREWKADYITDNPEEFHRTVFSHIQCNVVVDESGTMIGRAGGVMNELATRGRHYGHQCFFLSQRANMVDISTRTNCINLIAFIQSHYDAKLLYSDFVDPLLLKIPELPPGRAIVKLHNKPAGYLQVFT